MAEKSPFSIFKKCTKSSLEPEIRQASLAGEKEAEMVTKSAKLMRGLRPATSRFVPIGF
jgi:hypothetical protein